MKLNNISKKQLAQSIGAIFCMGMINIGYAVDLPPPNPAAPELLNCQEVTNPDGTNSYFGHPCPQSRPGATIQINEGDTTFAITPEGQHPAVDPFDNPPGSNFLMTEYTNIRDSNNVEMPNTLPSTEDGKYNLHDGPVLTQSVDKTSPSDDLDMIIDAIENAAKHGGRVKKKMIKMGLDILEGNPIANRAYSGFPMLHYNGPNKVAIVEPTCGGNPCAEGQTPDGGNANVDMIFWDQHIESTAAFIDPSAVQDVPWTITYNVNVLRGGIEDFSPMTMHFDQTPGGTRGPFATSMDQTFFPMLEEGTRYTIKIKQTLGKYYNLTYTWGWRIHPPRVQVSENALKAPRGITLVQEEINVFGEDPMGSEENKLAAIAMIGDIAPAKRMWNIFRSMSKHGKKHRRKHDDDDHGYKHGKKRRHGKRFNKRQLKRIAANLRSAYLDWSDRTKLPAGVTADPAATITLLYANNTFYGNRQGLQGEGSGQGPASYKGICNGCALDWTIRPYVYNVTLYNGDNFQHAYMNVDFGGSRGWENQFQFTDPTTALADELHTDNTVITGQRTDVVNGEVIVSDSTVNVVDDHNVLLDLTTNLAKQALAVDQSTGLAVISNDKIFPTNTSGTEEFLEPTPRILNDNGTIDNNADLQLGSGCFFTFGRNHAWPNAGGPWGGIFVDPVDESGNLGMHKVEIHYNFEPSRRLRIYQFDPLHHDVAIYSLH